MDNFIASPMAAPRVLLFTGGYEVTKRPLGDGFVGVPFTRALHIIKFAWCILTARSNRTPS